MTKDVIALTPKMPDVSTLLAGLHAGGPDLGLNTLADGAVIQLCAPDGRALVSVEASLLVQVPGETARLLGPGLPDSPVWWTEARASTAVEEGGRLAGSFAGRLATVLKGSVWPPEAASTDVVPPRFDIAAVPAPPTSTPAVDVLTARTAVVIQERPVVAMTSWLSDALRTTAHSERALQIVTPPTSRLTLPTRTALRGHPNRWVVQDPNRGYYDGLSGAVLRWHGGAFTPTLGENGSASVAEAFKPAGDSGERQLILSLRAQHPATEDLVLGRCLEATWQTLTGAPPAGWSTAEPVNLPWSTRRLTEFARTRSPRPTWLIAIGHPDRTAMATVSVTRTPVGVEEDITLALGYGRDETPPLDAIEPLAKALAAEHGLTTMLTSLRAARRDLTVPPRFEAPSLPISFTLGNEAIKDIGLARALRPPLDLTPTRLGPTGEPCLHYPLGDGTDARSWTRLQRLTEHLGRS
ncbi:DUF6177 family protein [Streptomyces sp. HSG2]|uniref:DUF6177 family protein n=1 Tax=Streptomyces sp. HSG2 TaxID=2797167 RepID=UPI00190579D4|nr:DUF6177 family protein [Streptomyces sp. HSG2]